jgi:hypothetical protein
VKKRRFSTIKEYAVFLLVKTDFVDCYGRNIGHDYETILAKIKREFPHARTTKRALRYVLYGIDQKVRLPARHRSRKILAREFARALLTQTDESGVGFSFDTIRLRTRSRFRGAPALSIRTLKSFTETLIREKIKLPERRA